MVYPKSGSLLRPLGRGRSDGKRWPYTSFALVTFLRPWGTFWLLRMYILQTKTSLRLAVHEYNISQRGKMIGWLGGFCGHDSATDQASDMRDEFATDSCFIDVDMESKRFPVILYISSFLSLSSDWLIDKNFLETFLSGKKISSHLPIFSANTCHRILFCFIFQRDGTLKQYGFFRQVFLQHFINFQLRACHLGICSVCLLQIWQKTKICIFIWCPHRALEQAIFKFWLVSIH